MKHLTETQYAEAASICSVDFVEMRQFVCKETDGELVLVARFPVFKMREGNRDEFTPNENETLQDAIERVKKSWGVK